MSDKTLPFLGMSDAVLIAAGVGIIMATLAASRVPDAMNQPG